MTIVAEARRLPYQGVAAISGVATSGGRGSVTVALESQAFPYTGPYSQVGGTLRSHSSAGRYRFTVPNLPISMRLRVVTRTGPAVTSVARTVYATVRAGLTATRWPGRRVRFTGEIRPDLRRGTASLQRRKSGRWLSVRRAQIRRLSNGRRGYRLTVSARRAATVYRVLVVPPRSTGFVRGSSREPRVAGLALRPRR